MRTGAVVVPFLVMAVVPFIGPTASAAPCNPNLGNLLAPGAALQETLAYYGCWAERLGLPNCGEEPCSSHEDDIDQQLPIPEVEGSPPIIMAPELPEVKAPAPPPPPELPSVALPDPRAPGISPPSIPLPLTGLPQPPGLPSLTPLPTEQDRTMPAVRSLIGGTVALQEWGAISAPLPTAAWVAAPQSPSDEPMILAVGATKTSASSPAPAAADPEPWSRLLWAAGLAAIGLSAACVLLPLYSRIVRSRVLEQPARRAIHAHILANPGATTTELAAVARASFATAAWHLRVLVRHGFIAALPGTRGARYFENGGRFSPEDRARLALLRKPENAAFVRAVEAHPGLGVTEMARRLGLAKSTVSRRASILLAAGLLRHEGNGFARTQPSLAAGHSMPSR